MAEERRSAAARAARLDVLNAAARPLITPSLLNCDFARMAEELDALKRAGAVAVHLDVMDGHFVPNLSYGAPVIADWRKRTDFPFDTHLMISDPAPLPRRLRPRRLRRDHLPHRGGPRPAPPAPPDPRRGLPGGAGPQPSHAVLGDRALPGRSGCRAGHERDARLRRPEVRGRGARQGSRGCGRRGPGCGSRSTAGSTPTTAGAAVAAGATQLVAGSAVFRNDGNYAAALAELAEAARRGSAVRWRPGPHGRAAVPRMTQVVLIRPGATVYDEQNRVQGILDIPLERARPRRGRPARRDARRAPRRHRPGGPLLRPRRERRPHRRGRRQGASASGPSGSTTSATSTRGSGRGSSSTRSSGATSRSSASGSTIPSPSARPRARPSTTPWNGSRRRSGP